MTDDLTRPIETRAEPGTQPVEEAPVQEPAATASEPMSPPLATDTVMAGSAGPVSAGGSRLRWLIALGVAGLAIAMVIGAIVLFGSRPAPEALKYIPADAALVVEIRPDLPGDQVQKLGNLLAHFPGFLDQATLPDKLDESFSRLVGQGTGGAVDYRADIKPWLSGPAFVAFRPDAGASTTDPSSLNRGVVSLTTTGAVACDAAFKSQSVTHETYRSLDLVIGVDGAAACVLQGRQALVGDTQSVRDALDTHADGKGMDKSSAYQQARASLQGDQLLTMYINGSSYNTFSSSLLQGVSGVPGSFPGLLPAFPEWAIAGFRVEDDALVMDALAAPAPSPTAGATLGPSLLPIPAAHPSVIGPMAPANTLFFLEAQGAGVGLQNILTMLRTVPELQSALQLLDGAGGAGQLVGWIDDAGVIVANGPDGPTGGVLLVATDAAAASQRVSTLSGLLAFAGIGGASIQTRETTIAGVQVTTVTIADLGSLVPPGQLPPGVDVPSDAKLEFSIAAKDRVVLLGSGESFMTAVLNVQPGAALSDQAFYKQATSRALPGSQFTAFAGVRDIVGLVEGMLPAEAKGRWEADIKPYVAPFQAISITSASTQGGVTHARYILSISNP